MRGRARRRGWRRAPPWGPSPRCTSSTTPCHCSSSPASSPNSALSRPQACQSFCVRNKMMMQPPALPLHSGLNMCDKLDGCADRVKLFATQTRPGQLVDSALLLMSARPGHPTSGSCCRSCHSVGQAVLCPTAASVALLGAVRHDAQLRQLGLSPAAYLAQRTWYTLSATERCTQHNRPRHLATVVFNRLQSLGWRDLSCTPCACQRLLTSAVLVMLRLYVQAPCHVLRPLYALFQSRP